MYRPSTGFRLRSRHSLSFPATVLGVLSLTAPALAQWHNLINNSGFESPVVTTCARTADEGSTISDNWRTFYQTADINWEDCRTFGYFKPSSDGSQWAFLFNGIEWVNGVDIGHEGVTTEFKSPMVVGATYDLSFLGITRNPLKCGRGKVKIYLSETEFQDHVYPTGTLIWGGSSEDDGELKGRAKQWHKYTKSFTADHPYKYIAIIAVDGCVNGRNSVGLDDVRLTEFTSECPGNIVPNPGFETPRSSSELGWPKYWDDIQGDYGAMFNNAYTSTDDDIQFMDNANSGSCWFTLRSFEGTNSDANSAIGIELAKPMVVGQRYHIQFHGATKNPLFRGKGKVRWMADTQPITWDWNTDGYLTGSEIWGDMTVTGETTEWRQYDNMNSFVADRAYTYIAVQARDGYHVSIDDICITADPFLPGTVQFAKPEYSVTESQGPATITLERVDGFGGEATVTLHTIANGGTATSDVDFTSVTTTVHFDDGQQTQTVNIPIIDDSQIEGDETVALVIDNPSSGITIGRAAATLTIVDDPGGKAQRSGGNGAPLIAGKMTSTTTLTPEDQLRRGRIVWASNRSGNNSLAPVDNIFYKDVRSNTAPIIIPGTSEGRHPRWSYNGRYVAYIKTETHQAVQGDVITYTTGDCLKIVDLKGNLLGSYFGPTVFGAHNLGAPAWSKSGNRIAISYYDTWPSVGIQTLDFSAAYTFAGPTTTTLISDAAGVTAIDPVFNPTTGAIYYHGADAGGYDPHSYLYRLDLTPGAQPVRLDGNGDPIDYAFHTSMSPDGGRLLYSSSAYQVAPYDEIFEDDEMLQLDLGTGKATRVTAESENDWGAFATGGLARGEFVRVNELDPSKNELFVQKGSTVADVYTADPDNAFNDHDADWLLTSMSIWDLTGSLNTSGPGAVLHWSDIKVDPTEGTHQNVERSFDGVTWQKIGEVSRSEELNTEFPGDFTDLEAFDSGALVVYYRLSINDVEYPETLVTSDVVEVHADGEAGGDPDLQ